MHTACHCVRCATGRVGADQACAFSDVFVHVCLHMYIQYICTYACMKHVLFTCVCTVHYSYNMYVRMYVRNIMYCVFNMCGITDLCRLDLYYMCELFFYCNVCSYVSVYCVYVFTLS